MISTDLGAKDDLFAFKISYNTPTDNAKALFNGNISETYWRTLYDDQQRKYTYTYDHLNRLLLADYSRPDNASIMNAYKESVSYDKNGNIMELNRTGGYEGEDYEIDTDKLVYTYDANNKNRLLKVTDTSGSLDGFAENMDPNGTGNDDYAYDANGNMTRDDNKAITSITYNHLNLPFTITFYNPHGKQTKIEYIYDATGSKKAKKVHYYEPDYSGGGGSGMRGTTANATPTNSSVGPTTYLQKLTRTDYMAGGYQYKDEVIEFIPHAEGFIKNEKGSYVYYFNYTDHLGNVRVTYTDDGSGTPYVVEESNYYPFGLKHKGYNEPEQSMKDWGNILTMESSLNHKYKYLGQEWQDELGLNWYSYRHRNGDPAIGRFFGIDPVSEEYMSISTYQFAHNNPVWKVEIEGLEGKESNGAKDVNNHEPVKVKSAPALGFVGGGLVDVKVVQETVKETVETTIGKSSGGFFSGALKVLGTAVSLLTDYMSPNYGGRTSEMQFSIDHKIEGDNVVTNITSQPYNTDTKNDDGGDVIYRGGPFTDSNFTPRPGKDDGIGPKSGLSTNVDPLRATQGYGGKAQALSVDLLKRMGFQLTKTPDGHVGIRPPSQALLEKWAASRGETSVMNPAQILTEMVKSTRIEEIKVPKP